jgi:hypothetical protein
LLFRKEEQTGEDLKNLRLFSPPPLWQLENGQKTVFSWFLRHISKMPQYFLDPAMPLAMAASPS